MTNQYRPKRILSLAISREHDARSRPSGAHTIMGSTRLESFPAGSCLDSGRPP
jgi:hypothetical protein